MRGSVLSNNFTAFSEVEPVSALLQLSGSVDSVQSLLSPALPMLRPNLFIFGARNMARDWTGVPKGPGASQLPTFQKFLQKGF